MPGVSEHDGEEEGKGRDREGRRVDFAISVHSVRIDLLEIDIILLYHIMAQVYFLLELANLNSQLTTGENRFHYFMTIDTQRG